MKAKGEKGLGELRVMWGRWVREGKSGTQENPPRDTGEVSRGAFFPGCEIMWRLPYLEQVGRVVAKRGQFLLIPF